VCLSLVQASNVNDRKSPSWSINGLVKTDRAHVEVEEVGGHELSLSLTLQNPSPQTSNASYSASEISEAISCCPPSNPGPDGFSSYKDCSRISSTVNERINLDLSLAICGNWFDVISLCNIFYFRHNFTVPLSLFSLFYNFATFLVPTHRGACMPFHSDF